MILTHSSPQCRFFSSPLGGGWIVADTDTAAEFLEEYFSESAYDLGMQVRHFGWLVEPWQLEDLSKALLAADIRVASS